MSIETTTSEGKATGTGFLYSPRLVVSCLHCVEGARSISVRLRDGSYAAVGMIPWSSKKHDLVLLELASQPRILGKPISPVKIHQHRPAVASEVFLIGNPFGLTGTFSKGEVSTVRTNEGTEEYQISAPAAPGSSGSPVFDRLGRVIAIVRSGMGEGGSFTFATPVECLNYPSASPPIPIDKWYRSTARYTDAPSQSPPGSQAPEQPEPSPTPPPQPAPTQKVPDNPSGGASQSPGQEPLPPLEVSVWVNTGSGLYFLPGDHYYGRTKQGKYMSEQEAQSNGYRPAYGRHRRTRRASSP